MATTQPTLAAGRGLLAVRATLLSATGTRTNCGVADTTAYSTCVQSITPSTQTEAGETETIECGTGGVFATVTTEDTDTGIDLVLEMVSDDLELAWLMTGGELLLDAGNVIGLAQRAPGVAAPVFELHAWEEARSGASFASELPYIHHVWGNCTAKLGDKALGTSFGTRTINVSAAGVSGANIGNGSFLDIPVQAFEGDSNGAFYAWWRVDETDVPDADVSPYNNGLGGGFITTPACGS